MRHNRSQTKSRRSHHALTKRALVVDTKSGSTHLRHRVDPKTGMYKGKSVLNVVKKAERKTAKASAKSKK